MLRQRVLTALVLLPPVLATLWFGSTMLVAAVFGAVAMVGALEWAALTGVRAGHGQPALVPPPLQALYLAIAAALLATVALARDPIVTWALVAGTCLWWLLMLQWIARYDGVDTTTPPRWLKAGAGLVVIPGTIGAVALLHGTAGPEHHGPLRLMFAFFLIWAADVGAYFAGKALGRRKLAPRVSPGKSWEGVYGGIALSLVVAGVAGHWLFGLEGARWLPFLLLCVAVVMFSVIGDLGESLLKRQVGAKDSGTLLPGHGGVLDRIDALTAGLPALALGLRWIGL